ncbi:hypothetical protein CNMCM5793_006210 [Aspergillus hiratsukae]|uniref:C2H2-type domain-containing protein n=1 Tax=Aspergillus hiratsukae TaxID=1194566 RepID=A0A8H6PGL4_9EURO|nr:hypothetical protein CNMCM5793_006210 [Aspergillus hiratsukae]
MDRFIYLPEHRVLICKLCTYAVPPTYLRTHLKGHRNQIPGLNSAGAISALEKELRELPLIDPSQETVKFPSPDTMALPGLPVQEGLQCKQCRYITCSKAWMQQHLQSHRPARQARGRPRKTAERITGPQAEDQTLWGKVHCQRFFVSGPQSRFFQVAPLLEPAVDRINCIRAQVYEQIRQCEQAEERSSQVITTLRDYSEANPWLDKTRWRDYTQGYTFTELAALAYMPDPVQEPVLQLWTESLDAVVNQAIRSVSDHRVNAFDLARINSFIDDAY